MNGVSAVRCPGAPHRGAPTRLAQFPRKLNADAGGPVAFSKSPACCAHSRGACKNFPKSLKSNCKAVEAEVEVHSPYVAAV